MNPLHEQFLFLLASVDQVGEELTALQHLLNRVPDDARARFCRKAAVKLALVRTRLSELADWADLEDLLT